MSAIPLRWRRVIVAAAAVIGSIHALYFLQDAWLDRAEAEEKTTRLEIDLDYDQRKLVNRELFADQLATMRPWLAQLEAKLPTHLDSASLEASLRNQAAQSNVEITDLHFGAEILKEGFYANVPALLRVRGATKNVVGFLDGLLRAPPIRYVRAMRMQATEGPGVELLLDIAYAHKVVE